MTRAGEGKGGALQPRTYFLIAALVLVALWAQPWAPRKRPAAGPSPAPAAATAAGPSSLPPPSPASPAAPGWGRDPFDPRPTASGNQTTGR